MSSGIDDRDPRPAVWGVNGSVLAASRLDHLARHGVPLAGVPSGPAHSESYVREVGGARHDSSTSRGSFGSSARAPARTSRVFRFSSSGGGFAYRDETAESSRQLQLTLCLAGTARFQCGSQIQHIRPSTIAWSVPSLRFQFVDGSSDYDAWVADVDGAVVERWGIGMHQRQGAGLLRLLTAETSERLRAQFAYLSELNTVTDQFAVGLEYLVLSAWAEQHRATRVDELSDVHPVVEKAAQQLREQPEQGSLRELAKACGASASWLSRLFREQLGVSLVGYRNQARIDRFFELYREGRGLNLSDAALGAGFGSYAQFHRVFKDTLGFAPGDLKRGVRGALESVRPSSTE